MHTPVVKQLVETYSVAQLTEAEHALINNLPMPLEVEGNDESEKLTHTIAALWILERMQEARTGFEEALREYQLKVRESIH